MSRSRPRVDSRCSAWIDSGEVCGKQRLGKRLPARGMMQLSAQAMGEIDGDLPVIARLAGRRDGSANARDPPFGV